MPDALTDIQREMVARWVNLRTQRDLLIRVAALYQEATRVAIEALQAVRGESLEAAMALQRIAQLTVAAVGVEGDVLALAEAADAAREEGGYEP
jgi:hypothetical protein